MRNLRIIIDTPFILFMYLCTMYFLVRNLKYFKSVDTLTAMEKIKDYTESSYPFFEKIRPHVVGIFWISILLIILN